MLAEGSGITIGLAAIILGAVATAWWKLDSRFDDEASARHTLANDLANYKLFVAQNHVTSVALRETEERLINALDKLSARFETMIARIESISSADRRPGR